jgi:hypothetical protein
MMMKAMTTVTEDKYAGSPAKDYGYGRAAPSQNLLDVLPARPRRLRRNSCIIRGQNPSPLRIIYWMVYCACPIVTLNCRMECYVCLKRCWLHVRIVFSMFAY